jgi:hypothetical protein
MLSNSAPARVLSSGTSRSTRRTPVASQPLSTDERIGVSGSPVGGHVVSFSPLRWSYQLKNWPLGSWRSIRSSVPIVFSRRASASALPMIPSSLAARVLHM